MKERLGRRQSMSRIGQAPVSVTADELEAQLDEQPELLEALCNGSIDAFVDFFELVPGVKVTGVSVRELST